MEFDHYKEVPFNIAQEIMGKAESKLEKES
jgi:translation elongation factor EF-G